MEENANLMIAPEIKERFMPFFDNLQEYADKKGISIFVLQVPLIDNRYEISYGAGCVILTQGHKLMFVDLNDNKGSEIFKDFVEDSIEDIASIADRYDYKKIIGRPRNWKDDLIITCNFSEIKDIEDFLDSNQLPPASLHLRRIKYLISLFIGSINDAKTATVDTPTDNLDSIKHKIQLFDCDQTRFIYGSSPHSKVYKIQGLSGTGKTELLLHKLKEIYLADNFSRIGFTCYNRVLADSLKKRIPEFFDFMNVQRQIDWHDRLLCVKAWGEFSDPKSGIYRFICSFYDIPFYNYREVRSFDTACLRAIEILTEKKQKVGFKFAFQYIFIDESQDFSNSFIKLCEIVTEKNVFAAGDIFQSIYANSEDEDTVTGNLMLYKCYRTAPKTFMVSQALGWGLFEKKKIRWLSDKAWNLCGYNAKYLNDEKIELTRNPLTRFDGDIDDNSCFSLIETDNPIKAITNIIDNLKEKYPSFSCNDICIIFIDQEKYIYDIIPSLCFMLRSRYDWECNIAYETKQNIKDQVFITNNKNVKGLEFPYVICYTHGLNSNILHRNRLYTMISRSLLNTYLIVKKTDNGITDEIRNGIKKIMNTGKMVLSVLSKTEFEEMRHRSLVFKHNQSLEGKIKNALAILNLPLENTRTVAEYIERSDNIIESEAEIENFIQNLSNLGLLSKS